ncbi:hypothetical protein TRICI_000774 [Trichomonascus ciferrii]|uniref:t-SNARE coiled-coil homology domain-containing protein n=1 Tax=Trichomonascus ciferrii TaxID=44093 RepID=A0A642VAG1_9ASCO|nr:hypothetical protein TRICI_000774 [Trichomonascus ciferrii]
MKKMFGKKNKELTPEQHRELLEEAGVPVKSKNKRGTKFGQYSEHAQRLTSGGAGQGPPPASGNPYANVPPPGPGGNPYAQQQGPPPGSNPYAGAQLSYQPSVASTNPPPSYRTMDNQPPVGPSPYASAETSYNTRFGSVSAGGETDERRNELFKGYNPPANGNGNANGGLPGRSTMSSPANDDDEEIVRPNSSNNNNGTDSYGNEEKEMDSEDEDVEAIKSQMRFTKQQSAQSTRNALRIAAEAEESGRNTLGMLGSQGERLANTEHNLALASTQNKIAEEKARELKKLNRSLFAIHASNPFSAKRRLQEKEQQIKAEHRQGQIERETRRQTAYDSSQRVQGGLKSKSELAQKYKQRNTLERSKYQFEADSEDEDIENEIDDNLDGISAAVGRLNKLAVTTNEEVNRQNDRLDVIADNTDNLDINVHLNTSRLANIK